MKFIEKLSNSWESSSSMLCIGIDPNPDRLPKHLFDNEEPYFNFAKAIIDHTHDLVCAYKFQAACYQSAGKEQQLEKSITYLRTTFPHIPIILDAKRSDIESSAEYYAAEAFVRYQADAVTVNPYMGFDTVKPFLNYQNKGIIVLCKTSNPGSKDFQELIVDGMPLYEKVATTVSEQWNSFNNCLLVVGGTWPEQLANLRKKVNTIPFLVPGIGEQNADLEQVIRAGINSNGTGLIISSSGHITYAGSGVDFAAKSRNVSLSIYNNINELRSIYNAKD